MKMANQRLNEEEINNIKEVIKQLKRWCEEELSIEEVEELSMDLYTLHDNLEFDLKLMKKEE
jgi:hypothetical protein